MLAICIYMCVCVCVMWYLDLTESHEVQLSEKMVPGKRFGHERDEVTCN